MNTKILIASVLAFSIVSFASTASEAAPKKAAAAAAKKPELPTVLTGFPTNLTIEVLRCVRANVAEFGRNNIVVLQFRLKKVGPNTGAVKYFGDARFIPLEIKAKDASLGSSYEVISGAGHEHPTRSGDTDTTNWKVGQTGDGYVWFKIPDDVNTLDIFFPKTNPVRVSVEVPKG
ncbi:MAG: hypothetical protein K2X27_23465 [Candidatus Obscuribacterales bacterium]|nr:hypothetical protein [Candidatus Obscuribacterales bacterium]